MGFPFSLCLLASMQIPLKETLACVCWLIIQLVMDENVRKSLLERFNRSRRQWREKYTNWRTGKVRQSSTLGSLGT